MAYRKLRPFMRYAVPAGTAIAKGVATQVKQRWSRSNTRTRTKKKQKSGSGTTTQYDRILQYRRRRMPRRKKRSWVKFQRKVRAALQKDLGNRTILFNHLLNTTGSVTDATTQQGTAEVHLYGHKGSPDGPTQGGSRDILRIMNNDSVALDGSGKVRFRSAVLDITVRNAGSEHATPWPVELDVYEIGWYKRTAYLDCTAALVDGFAATGNINTGTGLTVSNRGVTPWECPEGISLGGFRIYKKTKYFLNTGQTMTYQVRDPRNHFYSRGDAIQTEVPSGVAWPGVTKTLLFIWKAVPGGLATDIPRLYIGSTRKYSYSVMQENRDADNLNPV